MNILFTRKAWEEYSDWIINDKKIIIRINHLIKDIQNNPYLGIGKPEPLKFNLTGYWSRRINDEHRLIYQIKDDNILIISCKYHYKK